MPQQNNSINGLEISNEDLVTLNVSNFIRIFRAPRPTVATQLKGRNVILFPKYDRDTRPNSVIQEIRDYITELHSEVPHFPYFLAPELPVGGVFFYITSLLPLSNISVSDSEISINMNSKKFVEKVIDLLSPTKEYCETIYDDPRATVVSLIESFPLDVRSLILERMFS